MKKTLQLIGLTLVIALLAQATLVLLFSPVHTGEDASLNEIEARTLLIHLRDGQSFRLSDAYPDLWQSVEVTRGGRALTDWEWRALRDFDAELSQPQEEQQLLVFWYGGEITRVVRFDRRRSGMPWFVVENDAEQSLVLSRKDAMFHATLRHENGVDYYLCEPESEQAQI